MRVVRSPYLKENINRLEAVQRFFTKKILQRCGIQSSSYEDRLSKLNLKSLEHRRLVTDMVMVYKIIHNYVDIDPNLLFTFKPNIYNLRGHNLTLSKPKVNSNVALNSFTSRVVRLWNSLPSYIVESVSVSSFKFQIKKLDLLSLKRNNML